MILPELVGAIASFASVLISQPPQISRQDPQRESGSTPVENHEHEAKWKDVIHREYERGNESKLQDTNSINSVYYVSIGNESCIKPSFRQSLHKSLRSNIGIMLAVIPLGLSAISYAYFELKTSCLCFGLVYHNNSIPFSVTRWQLIGEDISSIPFFIWFPVNGIQVELPFNFDHCFRCRSYFDNLQIVFGSFWCFQNKDVLQVTIIIILISLLLFLLAFRPGLRCC